MTSAIALNEIMYSAGQKTVVKGPVSRCVNHSTFDHVFLPAEYIMLHKRKLWNRSLYLLQVIFQLRSRQLQKFNCTVPWVPDPVVCNWTTPSITDVVTEYVGFFEIVYTLHS